MPLMFRVRNGKDTATQYNTRLAIVQARVRSMVLTLVRNSTASQRGQRAAARSGTGGICCTRSHWWQAMGFIPVNLSSAEEETSTIRIQTSKMIKGTDL